MKKHGYILRYYLPIPPHFDKRCTERRFQELLAFCERTSTEAVMFYVALDPNWYYMSDTVEETADARAQMLPFIARLREAGIGYHLNFQNLLGSICGGADFTEKYDWECLVDHRGRPAHGCACPLGKKFRKQTEKRLRLWAETEPDVIWLDDDLRLHNHGTPLWAAKEGDSPYLDFYCFCDEHIRRFNEANHTSYTRETLVAEMTEVGSASPVRARYHEFLGETVCDTAEWIRKTVKSVSPHTRLAQMTSRPDVHAAEGRPWNRFLTALCGNDIPILRPHFGPYGEKDPRDFVMCYQFLAQTIQQVDADGVPDAAFCPEIENTRFTVWAKSAAATAMQLSLSAFLGCEKTTLSLYDLDGGALSDEPLYEAMLIQEKKGLDTLTSLDLMHCPDGGVIIPTSPKSGTQYRFRKGESYEIMGGKNRSLDSYLLRMGVPCRYLAPNQIKDGIVALDGFSAGFLSDSELDTLLRGTLLLDGSAANILLERGFGAHIGINAMSPRQTVVNAELFSEITREDGTPIRVPSRIPIDCWYETDLSPRARLHSEFLDPLGNRFPALFSYNNENGGQILVYPARNKFGSGFFTHHRVRLWKKLLSELDPELPRVDCHSYTLTAVKEAENGSRYFWIANLSADPTETVTLDGSPMDCHLSLYETAVFEKSGDRICRIK